MKHTIKQNKQVLGVLDAVITHVVETTEATFNWTGPKFTKEQWHEMLAFFKWTYDINKSESQVRLFVNKDRWAIWAFPQKANTGMTSHEMETEESVKQRDLFQPPPKGDWTYFGTVHHHCGASAFQSGTDAANEEKIDGLHITIGKMDEKKHDLHARMLIGGLTYKANMTWFWDIGDLKDEFPEDMHHVVATHQMCKPAPKDTQFPQQWKDNYIEVKPVVTEIKAHQDWHGHGGSYNYGLSEEDRNCKLASWKIQKLVKMVDDFQADLIVRGVDIEEEEWFSYVLSYDTMDHSIMDFIRCMGKHDVQWEDIMAYAEFKEEMAIKRAKEEEEAESKLTEDEKKELEEEKQMQELRDEMRAAGHDPIPDDEDVAAYNREMQDKRDQLAKMKEEMEAEDRKKKLMEQQQEAIDNFYGAH